MGDLFFKRWRFWPLSGAYVPGGAGHVKCFGSSYGWLRDDVHPELKGQRMLVLPFIRMDWASGHWSLTWRWPTITWKSATKTYQRSVTP